MVHLSLARGYGGEKMALMLVNYLTQDERKHNNLIELYDKIAVVVPTDSVATPTGIYAKETILHIACRRNYKELCTLLLQLCPKIKMWTRFCNRSPMSYSIALGYTDITLLLAGHCENENCAARTIGNWFRNNIFRSRRK
jgi:hypothetical protein